MRAPSAVLVSLSLLALATSADAQASAAKATIDPGMSKAQVVEHLGKPSGERTRGEFTYLFFVNGMEKTVGMSDIVTLQGDKVIDAVFRSSKRTYSGTSSSPKAIGAKEAAKHKPVPKSGGSTP